MADLARNALWHGPCIKGHETVLDSFAKVAALAGGGAVRLMDQRIDSGTDKANETGTLIIGGHLATLQQPVTNVFRKSRGTWRLAHHHRDMSEAILKIPERATKAAAAHRVLRARPEARPDGSVLIWFTLV